MGLSRIKIHFQEGIPDLAKIRQHFLEQTGYELWVDANLNLTQLCSPIEISKALQRDLSEVITIQKERKNFSQEFPANYEHQAKLRDELHRLNHISSLSFSTWFGSINFEVKDNCLIIESEVGQFYRVESLTKVLITLGGSFRNEAILADAKRKWKKLKVWNEYKWFNRPRK